MAKKIKTFNVDEETYSALVEMFKKYGVDVSVSSYVNGCLKELLNGLQEVEQGLNEFSIDGKKLTVPMAFIINSMVTSKGLSSEGDDDLLPEDKYHVRFVELQEWQYDYDSRRRRIPVQFVRLLESKLFELSPDKKYLIDKETGKKYVAGKTRNSIIEVEG